MKFSCKKNKFAQLFTLASSAVSLRDVKAVLQNVKLLAGDGQITMMATDLDISVRLTMNEVDVTEPGETILPVRLVRRSLQTSMDDLFTFESRGNRISLFNNRYGEIPTQPADDFPNVATFASDAYHEISAKVFRDMVHRCSFATDTESAKYTLCGVLFEFTEGRMAAVATNGCRLANQEGTAVSHGGHFSENTAIVPLKALALADKTILSDEETVRVAVEGGKIAIGMDNAVVFSRLVEGRFPRWKNIIPNTESRMRIDLMVSPLLLAVQQAEIVTTEKNPGIFLNFSEGRLEITGSGAEVGESRIELPISYTGERYSTKLEPRFLTDFLKALSGDSVLSIYLSENQSILFKTDDGYNYVVMPMM